MTARVIFWVDEFYPHTGGLERRIKSLADRLRTRIDVAVVTHSPPAPDDVAYPVVTVGPDEGVGGGEERVRHLVTASSCVYVGRLLPGQELAHAHSIGRLPGDAAILLRAQSTKAAHILASPDVREVLDGRVNAIHALNPVSFDLLADRYSRTAVRFAPNSLDIAPLPELNRAGPIISAGRIVPEKRTVEIIKAWRRVREVRQVPPLHVYGRVVDRGYFAACMSAIDGSDASYRGEYGFTDWGPLRGASAVVIASDREGHSNLAVEAMMHGAILVARSIPGLAEHVADGRGVTFPAGGGVDEITAALHSLLDLPEAVRVSMRHAAHTYARDLARHDAQLASIRQVFGMSHEL